MEKEFQKIVLKRAILVGFWGGIIWGVLFLMMYLFNMVEVDHIAIFKKWIQDEWVNKWYAHIIFLFMLSIISIFFSILYYFILRNRKSWVVGAIYGSSVWIIIYYILPVLTTGFNPFTQFEMETHIGTICNFILYGVFVGYTISYDNEHMNHELKKQAKEGEYQI